MALIAGLESVLPAAAPSTTPQKSPHLSTLAGGSERLGDAERSSSGPAQTTISPPKPAASPEEAPLPPIAGPSRPQCPEDTGQALFCVYTVREGDTLTSIAQALQVEGSPGVPSAELLAQSNKPDLVSSDEIVPGQKLRVPREQGLLHTVLSPDETLSGLEEAYGVPPDQVRDVAVNSVQGDIIVLGRDLLIPRPQKLPDPPPVQQPEPAPPPAPGPPAPQPGPPQSVYGFIWPVDGHITSYFGPSHPLGIDIGLDLRTPPIVAAKAGTVTFAGGNACCSYGYYVIVDHGGGLTTLYGHFSSIAVSKGQWVAQGQTLGDGGHTGYATGSHLHFEVRVRGAVQDPLVYLP